MEIRSMFVHYSEWNGKDSFRLIPITTECPFNEVLYDPENKVLMVISKDKKEKPMFIPALDKKGKTITSRRTKEIQEERQVMDMYYEYYIESITDIKDFITMFAINYNHTALNVL